MRRAAQETLGAGRRPAEVAAFVRQRLEAPAGVAPAGSAADESAAAVVELLGPAAVDALHKVRPLCCAQCTDGSPPPARPQLAQLLARAKGSSAARARARLYLAASKYTTRLPPPRPAELRCVEQRTRVHSHVLRVFRAGLVPPRLMAALTGAALDLPPCLADPAAEIARVLQPARRALYVSLLSYQSAAPLALPLAELSETASAANGRVPLPALGITAEEVAAVARSRKWIAEDGLLPTGLVCLPRAGRVSSNNGMPAEVPVSGPVAVPDIPLSMCARGHLFSRPSSHPTTRGACRRMMDLLRCTGCAAKPWLAEDGTSDVAPDQWLFLVAAEWVRACVPVRWCRVPLTRHTLVAVLMRRPSGSCPRCVASTATTCRAASMRWCCRGWPRRCQRWTRCALPRPTLRWASG